MWSICIQKRLSTRSRICSCNTRLSCITFCKSINSIPKTKTTTSLWSPFIITTSTYRTKLFTKGSRYPVIPTRSFLIKVSKTTSNKISSQSQAISLNHFFIIILSIYRSLSTNYRCRHIIGISCSSSHATSSRLSTWGLRLLSHLL